MEITTSPRASLLWLTPQSHSAFKFALSLTKNWSELVNVNAHILGQ